METFGFSSRHFYRSEFSRSSAPVWEQRRISNQRSIHLHQALLKDVHTDRSTKLLCCWLLFGVPAESHCIRWCILRMTHLCVHTYFKESVLIGSINVIVDYFIFLYFVMLISYILGHICLPYVIIWYWVEKIGSKTAQKQIFQQISVVWAHDSD